MGSTDDGSNVEPQMESSVKNSKVARVLEEYDLTSLGDELERRWTGELETQYSLRQLADVLNQELLRSAMERADVQSLDGEVENTYRLLTDEDVSRGMRTQTRKTLQRDGVDVEQLLRDFVSHQAVHTYLTKYRGVRLPEERDEEDPVEKAAAAIERLKSRTVAVTGTTLERLESTDRITLGEFDVLVDIRIVCDECGVHLPIRELLEEGGCHCQ